MLHEAPAPAGPAAEPASARAGAGLSRSPRTERAGVEAAREAMQRLGGAAPSYGFVFASARHDLSTVMAAVAETTRCADLLGASSAGELTDQGFTHGGVAVLLLRQPRSVHQLVHAAGLREAHAETARRLTQGFEELAAAGRSRGWPHSTSVLLLDGLARTCEQAVRQVMLGTRPFQQVVGGAAGVDLGFPAAHVGARGQVGSDAGAVLHVFGPARWGVGLGHGLTPPAPRAAGTARLTVTRVTGNVLEELDGRPALEAYQRHAREQGRELPREEAVPYLAVNPLGVHFLDEIRSVRVASAVTERGGLVCTGELAPGSMVTILHADPRHLLDAAGRAAAAARKNLDGAEAAAVLLFDCGSRGQALGAAFDREVAAVAEVFPGVPLAGFLGYGEIARFRGRLDAWHECTAVVVAIPA